MWTLPTNTKQALYKHIVQLIEQAIETGQLTAGQKLPSERQLSDLLQVNRSTIIHALNTLTDRGILIRKIGSGTYVNNEKWGVQSTPLIHWQRLPDYARPKEDHYTLQANRLRNHANTTSIMDLANGDLPTDLLPSLSLPTLSWQELLHHEQKSEVAHLGLSSFRQCVQLHLKQRFKMDVPIEQILITSGTQQSLFLVSQALLKPGDAVGIEAPSYFYSLPLFQATGLRLYAIPTDEQGITLDGLDRLINKYPLKMIFVNPIFQNPTGFVMSKQRKQQLLSYCQRKQLPLVEDDAYSILSFNPQLDTHPIKALDKHQQVIYVGSLSKYLGKTIRAGWLIAPQAIVNKLAHIRQQLDAGLSVLPQLLAQHYLNTHYSTHSLHLQKVLAKRANHLISYLNSQFSDSLHFNLPKGGFHLYAQHLSHNTNVLNTFLQQLLNQRLLIARGSDFGDGPNYFRFSFTHFT